MIKIFIFILFIFILNKSISQNYYLYVSVKNEEYKPLSKNVIITKNKKLNTIFTKNSVYIYHQSFPKAKTPGLSDFYEIHFKGNIDTLENELRNNHFFNEIYRCDYYKSSQCENPVSTDDELLVNDPTTNYALQLLDAQCAWSITTGSQNIIVGVIDTEFDINHDDLKNQIIEVIGNIGQFFEAHGTSVSSCVAAEANNGIGIAGIGYNTKIKGYIVTRNELNYGNLWNQIWQAYLDGVNIINISWDGIGSEPNVLAIKEIIDNGTIIVLAAGNENIPNYTPHAAYANISGVIDVSGINHENMHGPTGHVHNQFVDVCALSKEVITCVPGNGYSKKGGTSFAAPQVSGVAALVLSVNTCLLPEEVEDIIKSTCDPIEDADYYIDPITGQSLIGYGHVNAYNAVLKAVDYYPLEIINPCSNIYDKHANNETYKSLAKNYFEINCPLDNGKNTFIRSETKISMKNGFRSGIPNSTSYFRASISNCTLNNYKKMPYSLNNKNLSNTDNSIDVNSTILLFPNPTTGVFTITTSDDSTVINNVRIYYTLSNEIYQSETNSNSVTVNISSYPKGIYIVKATTSDGKIFTDKIIYQ